MVEKSLKFPVSKAFIALPCQFTVGDIQSSKQRRRVSYFVVGSSLYMTQLHGQHQTCRTQSLTLTLLLHSQHQRIFRRTNAQSDYLADFFHEKPDHSTV